MLNYNILAGKTACYYTLGCKLNYAETSAIAQTLERYGVTRLNAKDHSHGADICIVNTCTVTEVADRKDRQAIHKIIKENPDALVVVTGCYAQLKPEVISAIEGVDLVVGAQQRAGIIDRIVESLELRDESLELRAESLPLNSPSQFFPSCSRGDRTRYFLKVQDGCDYFCTYCTVPFARGRSRNGSISSLVSQAEAVAAEGGKEIVITGVNTGDFGKTTGETFFQLIQALDKVEGIERYRISSIEPNLLTDEIIDWCATSRAFMPHFHIPLQSGCDEVLRLMHRRYDTDFFRRKIERIKHVMPHCFIGVDTIVGMRGETEECFDQAYRFIESLDISQLHVFSYSERPGTKALEIPHTVDPAEKHRRSQQLLALSAEKTRVFYTSFIGTQRTALIEHSSPRSKTMNGFTDNYIRVELPNQSQLDNQIVTLRLGPLNPQGDALKAEMF